ncbi:hypothetical protein M5X06_22370 [Paenibacillus alvei]|uniref:Uncharacterized protein n=1 Tax=Paenibacillus alvei TaxID=44250 RepID=A0ABT4H2J7_PAEAL|nr:hypothetical protein [Paenibacillus alvei]MCY9763174.1 hypothetical protein [Paenibacillus alvei]MCY9769536.1 hypothetical protein [Paenibacillus alvei]
MSKTIHILEEINDLINSIMFFFWMIIVPIYIFLFNQIDIAERVFHITLVAIPYISFSIFKSITANIKFESLLKIIFFIVYGMVLVNNIAFNELFSSSYIQVIGYGALLVIACINVIVNAISSIFRLLIVDMNTA